MSIQIPIDDRPIMPEYLLPENFNHSEINSGIKNDGLFQKQKDKNRNKRKQAKKQKRKNRK